MTRQAYPVPCRDWRRCSSCARPYGLALSRRWSRVKGLRAFVVLTMPAELGDWRVEANRRAMMRAWRRLYERLCRRFDRRPKLMHLKSTPAPAAVFISTFCGTGSGSTKASCHGWRPTAVSVRSATFRASAAASKWPPAAPVRAPRFATRRRLAFGSLPTLGRPAVKPRPATNAEAGSPMSASSAASTEMGPRLRNPDWRWSPVEPPSPIAESALNYWLLPDDYLPSRQPAPRPPPKVLLKPAEQFSLASPNHFWRARGKTALDRPRTRETALHLHDFGLPRPRYPGATAGRLRSAYASRAAAASIPPSLVRYRNICTNRATAGSLDQASSRRRDAN